jgi:TatD DNase family protein
VETVSAARAVGVEKILSVGLDEETNAETVALARETEGVWASVGRHPNQALGYDETAAAELSRLCEDEYVVAVGETGLDLYRQGAPIVDQRRAFSSQIAIAREFSLPVVVHLRDREGSEEITLEAFEILEREAIEIGVVIHCFSASADLARRAGANGWYCSFAGNLTYPSASDLREAARVVPEELLLVETDSPYLAPQPMRGTANRPANVVETARVLAAERDVSSESLAEQTDRNAARLFGW